MSSHHIVRDQQEPALIVQDISHFPLKPLNEILGWSPTVVCLESSVHQFVDYGLKLDHLIVDFKNEELINEKLVHQWPYKVHHAKEKPLFQAIELLKDSGHSSINIIIKTEEISEVTKQLRLFDTLFFTILTEDFRALYYNKNSFGKWLTKGSKIKLKSLNENVIFTTRGFENNLTKKGLDEKELVAMKDGKVMIEATETPFLIIESF